MQPITPICYGLVGVVLTDGQIRIAFDADKQVIHSSIKGA